MQTADLPRIYTVAEVSRIFGTDPSTVRRRIARGDLKAVRWGVELRVTQAALDAYIGAHPYSGPAAERRPRRGRAR